MSTKINIITPYSVLLTPVEEIKNYAKRIELYGRTCYKSEDKITDDSSNKFIDRLIKSGHESVLEHCSITVKIICDRSTSHQLVRHRIAAFSQESQRYVKYEKDSELDVICPPDIIADEFAYPAWLKTIDNMFEQYVEMRKFGIKAEDARSLLPNATKTEVVTTFNVRQWRHVFRERAFNPHAQWQIKGIMLGIFLAFANASNLFNDFEVRLVHGKDGYYPCYVNDNIAKEAESV